MAKKIEDREIFSSHPYQSDYVTSWNREEKKTKNSFVYKGFRKLKSIYNKYFIKYNSKFFKKIK